MAYENYSDEELARIAGVDVNTLKPLSSSNNYDNYTDQQLADIAGVDVDTLKPKKKSFGQRFEEVVTSLADNPVTEAVLSAGQGATQVLADIGNIPQNLIRRGLNAVAGEEVAPVFNFDVGAYQPGGPAKYPRIKEGAEIATTLGLPIPSIAAPKATKFVEKYLAALSKSKKAVPKLTGAALKGAADIASNAALPGAAYGATFGANNPDKTLAESAGQGALLGSAIFGGLEAPRLIGNAAKNIGNKLIEKSAPSIRLTPEEVEKYTATAQGLPIDIGALADNPQYSELYKNTLSNIPFSGVKKNMKQVVDAANAEKKDILNYFKGGKNADETTINSELLNEISKRYNENKSEVSNAFETVSKEADKARIYVTELPRVQEFSQSLLNDIKNEKGLNFPTHLEFDQKTMDALEGLAQGIPFTEKGASFSQADKVRKFFSRQARKHRLDKDQTLESVFSRLEKLTQEDLNAALDNANRNDLSQLWERGRQIHATEVQPYRKREIYQIIKNEKTPAKLHDYLMSPENQDIFNALSPSAQKKVIFKYLNKSFPYKRFEAMGAEGQSRLLSPVEIRRLQRFGELNRIATEYKPILKKPSTGIQAADLLKKASSIGIPVAALTHLFPGLPWYLSIPTGIAAGVALPAQGAKALNKRLTTITPEGLKKLEEPVLSLTKRGKNKAAEKSTRALLEIINSKQKINNLSGK